jgi:hypothetical protein
MGDRNKALSNCTALRLRGSASVIEGHQPLRSRSIGHWLLVTY